MKYYYVSYNHKDENGNICIGDAGLHSRFNYFDIVEFKEIQKLSGKKRNVVITFFTEINKAQFNDLENEAKGKLNEYTNYRPE